MKQVLAEIKDGSFAKRFIDDQDAGRPEFKALRDQGRAAPDRGDRRASCAGRLMSWITDRPAQQGHRASRPPAATSAGGGRPRPESRAWSDRTTS